MGSPSSTRFQVLWSLKKLHYLVLWEGYDPKENLWELAKNLKNALDAIEEFYKLHL